MTAGRNRLNDVKTHRTKSSVPTCGSGPFGRIIWTLRELWNLMHGLKDTDQ